MRKKYDVLAVGYYGFGNLGDELLADAVVKQLVDCGVPKERIALLSASPRESAVLCGVDAFDRWSISSVLKAMREARSLLLGGGGLFQNSTSLRSCVYYWGVVKLARLMGLSVWAAGQSIGPLNGMLAKALAKSAFASCTFRCVRDKISADILDSWHMDSVLSDDLVTSLGLNREFSRGRTMLLNLRPGYDNLSSSAAKTAALRAAADGLVVHGVAFSEEDASELEKFVDNGTLKLVQITVVKGLSDYENVLNGSCCAVGMRLHFIVLAALAGLPCSAVPYDPKVSSFCKRWHVPYFVSCDSPFSTAEVRTKEASEGVRDSFCAGLAAVMGENYGRS